MSDEFEEQLGALSILDDIKKANEALLAVRNENSPQRAEESRLRLNCSTLKSDLKKTTAFVKKLRVITSDGLLQCIRDVQTLNLKLYISEIVDAIIETNFKATDVPNVIKLCNELHLRYSDFTSPLVAGLKESLLATPDKDDTASDKRKRIQIRMIIELFKIGIFLDENFFSTLLRDITGKGASSAVVDLSSLVTFVKYAAEVLLGYVPTRTQAVAKKAGKTQSQIPSKQLSSQRLCTDLQMQLSAATDKLCADLLTAHKDLRARERKSEKDKLIHGGLSEQKAAELENSKRLFEKLLSSLTSLADSTGLDLVPQLQEEMEEQDGSGGISLWDGGAAAGQDYGPWGDAEAKAFYEELPDLLAMVPLNALGFSPEQAVQLREAWKAARERRSSGEGDLGAEAAELATVTDTGDDGETEAVGSEGEAKEAGGVEEGETEAGSNHMKLQVLLREKLPEATSKQKADDFCVAFCYVTTKKALKHLVAALLRVPRSRYELIPIYSRIAASLARLFPEIVKPLLEGIHKEFHGMYKTKNQQHIENKIKNIRFIGELVKFGVAPPITAFRVFNKLIADFVHHNVELCACLLETCGRYLYLTPYTHDRLEKVLDTVIRLRRAKNLDYRQQTALDEAYFAVKPPERTTRKKKEYTDIQLYVRHMMLSKLKSSNVDNIIRQLRKLPWNSPEEGVERVVVKSTMKLARAKYSNVPLATDCLSGLAKYHPNIIVRLVDSVIEELSRGLESPHKREQQKLVSYVRLISELYNFNTLSSSTVFDVMYLIISYGYCEESTTSSHMLQSFNMAGSSSTLLTLMIESMFQRRQFDTRRACDIDVPTDCFRVQLICEMLQACGMYFVRGLSRMKLEEFLLYFQKYLLCKPALPPHVEFSVLDMFDTLEQFAHEALKKEAKSKTPKGSKKIALVTTEVCFQRYSSLEDVCAAVSELESKKDDEARTRRQLAIEHGVVPTMEQEADEEDDDGDDEDECGDEEGEENGHGRRGGAEETEEAEEEGDEDAEEGDEAEDGEISRADATRLAAKLREVEEDEEFEKAFKSLMLESVEAVKPTGASLVKSGAVDRMAIPAFLPPPKNIVKGKGRVDEEESEDSSEEGNSDREDDGFVKQTAASTKRMPFKLLGRDGKGRVETRQLLIPEETKIAKKLLQADMQRKVEKEKLKEKVLLYESMQSTADGQYHGGSVSNTTPVQYLGGRDHFAGRGPNHRPLESNRWQASERSAAPAAVTPTGNTLNLSGFLAESSAAEARRYHTSAGRGTVGGSVSATVHGQHGRGRGGRSGAGEHSNRGGG